MTLICYTHFIFVLRGKSGLKTVLPIVAPEMEKAYSELDMVQHGGDAMNIYKKLEESSDIEEISRYKSSLLEYCKLDTYSMVKILGELRKII